MKPIKIITENDRFIKELEKLYRITGDFEVVEFSLSYSIDQCCVYVEIMYYFKGNFHSFYERLKRGKRKFKIEFLIKKFWKHLVEVGVL